MKNRFIFTKSLAATICLSLFSGVFASDIASISFNGDSISATPSVSYEVANLRVSNDTTDVSQVFQNGDGISISLSTMTDGLYHYKLSLINNAEAVAGANQKMSVSSQSGQFRIISGSASAYNSAIAGAEAQLVEANVGRKIVDGKYE